MNRAPVNGPVDDPTCNYNTGSDKPGESVSSSPGQTSAETAETTAGWLVLGQQDYARFAAWAGALSQGSFASLAGDWTLQRCSSKQARHWIDCKDFVPLSEPKTRWIEFAGVLTRVLPKNDTTRGRNGYLFVDIIFAGNECLSGTFSSATVDRIGCSSYPFCAIHWVSVSYAYSKRVALRNVSGSRLACLCSPKPTRYPWT